jgi:hypothetical protein
MPEQAILKGKWRTLADNDKQVVRSRTIWASGVKAPIADEYRLDKQSSDSWVEWVVIHPAHQQFVKVEKKIKTPRKTPEGLKRNDRGQFYKVE